MKPEKIKPEDLTRICSEYSTQYELDNPLNPLQFMYLIGQGMDDGRQRIETIARMIKESENPYHKEMENIL